MSSLLDLARRSGFAYEASPSGRWVKFVAGGSSVYVVEGAWGNSYLVWEGSDGQPDTVERYLRAEEALSAVRRLAS